MTKPISSVEETANGPSLHATECREPVCNNDDVGCVPASLLLHRGLGLGVPIVIAWGSVRVVIIRLRFWVHMVVVTRRPCV